MEKLELRKRDIKACMEEGKSGLLVKEMEWAAALYFTKVNRPGFSGDSGWHGPQPQWIASSGSSSRDAPRGFRPRELSPSSGHLEVRVLMTGYTWTSRFRSDGKWC